MAANELLALVVPGNRVDRLGDGQTGSGVRRGVEVKQGVAAVARTPRRPYGSARLSHHTRLCISYSGTDGESEIKEAAP